MVGFRWVVVGNFRVWLMVVGVLGGGAFILYGCGWWWVYFGRWWVLVGLFWVLLGSGGFILGGGGWWWIFFGWWRVEPRFIITQ